MDGTSIERIISMLAQRRMQQERWHADALLLRDLFNGDIDVPLPEMERNEKAAVANTAVVGLDHMATRAVSTQPNPYYFPVKPGQQRSEDLARKRRLVTLAWWDVNKVNLLDRQRARWLIGYGKAPVEIQARPRVAGADVDYPFWALRDPLTTYPAPSALQDSFSPRDCIYSYYQNFAWIERNYVDAAITIRQWAQANRDETWLTPATLFDLAEYVDAGEYVLCLVGERKLPWDNTLGPMGLAPIELQRTENRAGVCPVVTPSKINIDRTHSDYIELYGMYVMRAKLHALDYINIEKNVFAERWVEDLPNAPGGAQIRTRANPRAGIPGEIQGGHIVDLQQNPGFSAGQMLDRIEREERVRSSTLAETGGESANNIRTARRGSQIQEAAVDFTIQETQEIFEESKRLEDRIAVAFDLAYFNHPKSYFVGWRGEKKQQVDYKPSEIWENTAHSVAYAAAGADIQNLGIAGSQRIAQKSMSVQTFMETDPLIDDPALEHERIIAEQLEQSVLIELLQPGSMSVVDKNKIMTLVKSGKKTLAEAVEQVQKEAQDRQASVGEGEAAGAEPGTPEAQPGMQPQAPGMAPGVAGPPGATIGPAPNQKGLAQLLASLRGPQRLSPAESPPVAAGA